MINIIKVLKCHLPKFRRVLEIGSKEGQDLEILDGYYEVVASEDEKVKTRYLKDNFIDIRVILLDPISMETHKKFECIFSKNLLDELSLEQIETSLENQKNVLEGESLIFHIFRKEKVVKENIENLISKNYKIIDTQVIDGEFYFLAKLTL